MLGDGVLVQLFEGLDGPGVTQLQRLVRAEVAGLGQAGSQGDGGGGEQGSQFLHGNLSVGINRVAFDGLQINRALLIEAEFAARTWPGRAIG